MVDPLSLGTQKKSELGGLLRNPEDGFDAWARPDAEAGRLSQAFLEPGLPFIGGAAVAVRDFDDGFRSPGVAASVPLAKGETCVAWAATRARVAAVIRGADGLTAVVARKGGGDKPEFAVPLLLPADDDARLEVAAIADDGAATVLDVIVAGGPAPADGPEATRCWGELWRVRLEAGGAALERLAPERAKLGLPSRVAGRV